MPFGATAASSTRRRSVEPSDGLETLGVKGASPRETPRRRGALLLWTSGNPFNRASVKTRQDCRQPTSQVQGARRDSLVRSALSFERQETPGDEARPEEGTWPLKHL